MKKVYTPYFSELQQEIFELRTGVIEPLLKKLEVPILDDIIQPSDVSLALAKYGGVHTFINTYLLQYRDKVVEAKQQYHLWISPKINELLYNLYKKTLLDKSKITKSHAEYQISIAQPAEYQEYIDTIGLLENFVKYLESIIFGLKNIQLSLSSLSQSVRMDFYSN